MINLRQYKDLNIKLNEVNYNNTSYKHKISELTNIVRPLEENMKIFENKLYLSNDELEK